MNSSTECVCPFQARCHDLRQSLQIQFRQGHPWVQVIDCPFYRVFQEIEGEWLEENHLKEGSPW